jgi:YD repeat-containing protein
MRYSTWASAKFSRVAALLLTSVIIASSAPASENLNYTYDALGRLTKVARSGTVNNGASECYAYDKAENRSNVTASTSSDCSTAGQVSFSISNNGAVTEGSFSTFTITKSGIAPGTVTVNYATSNGSAVAPGDYTAASATLTFLVGDTTKTVNVATVDDTAGETAESFSMALSSPVGGTIATGSATGTINDNDGCNGVSFSISSNGAVTEGGTSVFTVTKSGATSSSCSVNYATASGSAGSGSDFNAVSGTLTFAAGQTSLTISVSTIDDTLVEGAESFSASLSSPTTGASIGTGTATATINDNDGCSGVSFTVSSNGAVTEGGTSGFTVTKSGATSSTCSVNYATASGAATSGSDFNAASGTLTFSPAQVSQAVNVTTIDDTSVESAETFTLSLSGPSGGSTIAAGTATATINDNDIASPCSSVSYVISDASGVEGDVLVFTVTKSGSTSSSCSVNYATADGTAIAGTHYVATSGTLTFSAVQTTASVNVTTFDLGRLNGIKTMNVNLSSPSGGATITDSQGVGSISAGGGIGCKTCF